MGGISQTPPPTANVILRNGLCQRARYIPGLGFAPLNSNQRATVPPPINVAIAAGGSPPGGIAAAPAAPQSNADAPAPAFAASPWLTDGGAPGFKQTSSDPPVAPSIFPIVPCGELIAPATFFGVRRMIQPSVNVIFTIFPCWSNSTVNFVFGAIQMLPKGPSLIVAPYPGVSMLAPEGIEAPLTALAPLTVIGLLPLVVSTPIS